MGTEGESLTVDCSGIDESLFSDPLLEGLLSFCAHSLLWSKIHKEQQERFSGVDLSFLWYLTKIIHPDYPGLANGCNF